MPPVQGARSLAVLAGCTHASSRLCAARPGLGLAGLGWAGGWTMDGGWETVESGDRASPGLAWPCLALPCLTHQHQ